MNRTATPSQQTNNPEQVDKNDLPLLNDLHAALQKETHRGLFSIVIFFFIFLVVFVVWAYNSTVEEISRGQGSIIPVSREQIIQSVEPGVIAEMKVKEGDLVETGQVLLVLDDTRSAAGLRESQAKADNLEAMAARLRSESDGTPLHFPERLTDDLVRRETAAYNARKRTLTDALDGLQKSKSALEREIAITRPMVRRGAMPEVELLRMQRQSAELNLQINERKNRYASDANNELTRVEAELDQVRENIAMRADPVKRALIRAPMRGIVKNIRIHTIGGVVNAGQDIMELVPVGDTLLAEAYISPRDVAFIRPGQPALVKVSAYDYAIYGGLQGKVILISPGTLYDQRRPSDLKLNPTEAFYRVLIETDNNGLTDKNGKILPILPGMIANVDIRTGEKTIFQYLIKPITRMKQALNER